MGRESVTIVAIDELAKECESIIAEGCLCPVRLRHVAEDLRAGRVDDAWSELELAAWMGDGRIVALRDAVARHLSVPLPWRHHPEDER